jgi:Glyoxalase-like domain
MAAKGSIRHALTRVDHLVYAAPDLAAGVAAVERLLGVRATPGGAHPNRGTRNALISLGARTYIEVIGPDLDQPVPADPRPFRIDELSTPRLVTWSAYESDLEGLLQRAAGSGITLGAIGAGSRTRPDGVLLTWQFTDPRALPADGVVPFFIDWGQTQHPAAGSTFGGRLVDLRAEHPESTGVRAQLAALGLDMAVSDAPAPAIIATIHGQLGPVELR